MKDSLESILNDLKKAKENIFLEFKKAGKNVPTSLWETYSAFCNTVGGTIILGIEEKKEENLILGVENSDDMLKNIWNTLNNKNKVSHNALEDSDLYKLEIEDKTIIIMNIKEVPNSEKPVYLNGDLKEIYIRQGEADKKATFDEIRNFISDATPKTRLIKNFSFDDLDLKTVKNFKSLVEEKYPNNKYNEMDEESFLKQIGAIRKDRKTNEYKLTEGCLLFLGKYLSITDYFSKYHLDFFYRGRDNERWLDRVNSDEPKYGEMNIFNFYNIVFEKIKINLKEKFELNEEKQRIVNFGNLEEAIREALVNTLIHADYSCNFPKVKVEMYEGWIYFENSGRMLITVDEYLEGGHSKLRNDNLVKLASLCGMAERQGFGGVKIYKTAEELSYQTPEIITNPEETTLKLWTLGILHFHKDLTVEEKSVYSLLLKEYFPQTKKEILEKTKLSNYSVRKSLEILIKKGLIVSSGAGRAVKYEISFGTQGYLTKLQLKLKNIAKYNNLISKNRV